MEARDEASIVGQVSAKELRVQYFALIQVLTPYQVSAKELRAGDPHLENLRIIPSIR